MSTHLQWRKRKSGMVAYVYEFWRENGKQKSRCLRRATDADLAGEGVVSTLPLAQNEPFVSTPVSTPKDTPKVDIGALIAGISAKHKAEPKAQPAPQPKPLWLIRQELQTERAREAAEGNGYWAD